MIHEPLTSKIISHSARTWQIVGFVATGAFAATWLVLQLTERASSNGGKGSSGWGDVVVADGEM